MAEPDYYGLLGVPKDATLHEIRSKFRQKVLAEHPDKGGDPKTFQQLNKAYNILTDQDKRRRYDATGRSEATAEEEFAAAFGGGRLHQEQRSKDADREAVVNMSERMARGPSEHEDGFQEWLRQRDQTEMTMTDKDFMKTALFNAAELATKVNHTGPVQHVLGSPKTDSYGQTLGGAVQVVSKPRPLKKMIDHDEVLVRMLAVPVDDSMVYAELTKSGICLGQTGIGRIEQAGSRITDLQQEDAVLVMPKPTKFQSSRPIGTARTLLICQEDDLIKVPAEILEELTPEQICLAPTIVCAYQLLENFGAKLKPGDSVLLNGAHLSASGSALLQLCKLLKLKPLCILTLPGAPKNIVKGEYGSKGAWQDADSRATSPPTIRAQYERISEWLIGMGAEEVFPDAVALLKWRDRNQRMLPKLALDGIATRESTEQLIHCLQSGDKDGVEVVVYGHGTTQPIEVTPPLLAAWGGALTGFSISRWVHQLSSNVKKMMAVMENITKLVRANRFSLDTVLYKVGEDAITDAFARQADAADSAQVVLIFPTLQEEMKNAGDVQPEKGGRAMAQDGDLVKKKEEDERDKLKAEWLNLLFTDQSCAATSPEGPLPVTMEGGNKRNPSSLVVWLGDNPKAENQFLKDLPASIGSAGLLSLSWSQHPAGEGLFEFSLNAPEIIDGSWYQRDRSNFENEDLDMLHDVELLGRSMIESVQTKLEDYGLDWRNVIFMGFGKGAGIIMYAVLMRLLPKPVSGMVLFSPIVPFPGYLQEKLSLMKRGAASIKLFNIWGNRNRATPAAYKQLLTAALRKATEIHTTPDTLPEGDHSFDGASMSMLTSLLPMVLR